MPTTSNHPWQTLTIPTKAGTKIDFRLWDPEVQQNVCSSWSKLSSEQHKVMELDAEFPKGKLWILSIYIWIDNLDKIA